MSTARHEGSQKRAETYTAWLYLQTVDIRCAHTACRGRSHARLEACVSEVLGPEIASAADQDFAFQTPGSRS